MGHKGTTELLSSTLKVSSTAKTSWIFARYAKAKKSRKLNLIEYNEHDMTDNLGLLGHAPVTPVAKKVTL